MKNKMNLNVVAETKEEKEIEKFLNLLHQSKEVTEFLNLMEKEARKHKVFKYLCRVKNVDSAIRTYRINKKGIDDVRDYVGISFITNDEKSIYPIIKFLKNKLPNGDYVDFLAEETIYSPLVYIKWVPPLGYNILSREELIPNKRKVPIEIRVCSKEAYISEQSAYYSIQKNDNTNLPINVKNDLRNIVQHITYKLALLNIRRLSANERKKQEAELLALIEKNKKFLEENKNLVEDAILDFGRTAYKCEHDSQIIESELSKDDIDNIDDKLKKIFGMYINETDENIIVKVYKAIEKIFKIPYEDIKKLEINKN